MNNTYEQWLDMIFEKACEENKEIVIKAGEEE